MPLTKLARRYHMQKRAEDCYGTPSRGLTNDVQKVLEFDSPDPPPYVTVRKSKKCSLASKSNIEVNTSLHTTVIESGNFGISDCQHWKRHESTHIDHVAGALGQMTIWTEDISAIQEAHSESTEEDSFQTAKEEKDEEDEPPKYNILADDSYCSKSSIPLISLSSSVSEGRVNHWVLSSPFHSPARRSPIRIETIIVSDSSEDEISRDEATSNFSSQGKRRQYSLSSSSCLSERGGKKINEDEEVVSDASRKVADLWCLQDEESLIGREEQSLPFSNKDLQVSLGSSRSIGLQVSLEFSSEDEKDESCNFRRSRATSTRSLESSFEEESKSPPRNAAINTLSEILDGEERNSQGNILFLEEDDGIRIILKRKSFPN